MFPFPVFFVVIRASEDLHNLSLNMVYRLREFFTFFLLKLFFHSMILHEYFNARQPRHMPHHVLMYAEHEGDLGFI